LEAAVFSWNTASARVLEKVGFQKEGVLRSYYWKNGGPVDGLMHSILNSDWKERKQKNAEE
jgi:ribosomal-protein-alanine N-acetyltransferase